MYAARSRGKYLIVKYVMIFISLSQVSKSDKRRDMILIEMWLAH